MNSFPHFWHACQTKCWNLCNKGRKFGSWKSKTRTIWPPCSQRLNISLPSHCLVWLSIIPVSAAASNDAISMLLSGGEYQCPGLTVTPLCDTSYSHCLHDSWVLIRGQVHLAFRQTALLMTFWNGPGLLSMTERSVQTPSSLFHCNTSRALVLMIMVLWKDGFAVLASYM